MAFIELTDEDLSLLNEREKKQYEKEYALYKERVAFVEQIERIEKSDYKYEKPKFKRIKPVRRLDLPKYKNDGKYKIVIDDALISRGNTLETINVKALANQKIKNGLLHKATIGTISKAKITMPLIDKVHIDNNKYMVRNIPVHKCRINNPEIQIGKVEKPTIQNISFKSTPKVHNIDFDYECKPIKVVPVKVHLPEKKKKISIDAVAIKNIPSVAFNQLQLHGYKHDPDFDNTINEIEGLVKTSKVATPQIDFNPVEIAIKEIEKFKIQSPDTSAIREEIDTKPQVSINNMPEITPVIPNIKKYKDIVFSVDTPKIKEVKCPHISQIESINTVSSVNISGSKVKVPMFKKYSNPTCEIKKPEAISIAYPKLKAIKRVEIGISAIPNIKVDVPSFSNDEVACLNDKILRNIQGV